MGSKKRSENTYQKINTLFKRDVKNIIMPYYEWCDTEIYWLKDLKFDCEEKIDGTNIRIEVMQTPIYDGTDNISGVRFDVTYKGKTDNADIPKKLMEYLTITYPAEKVYKGLGISEIIMLDEFADHGWCVSKDDLTPDYNKVPKKYTIYGEGYGAGIQKTGGRYIKNGVSFIGFDVKVNDTYLLKENRDTVFNKMECPIVPFIGQFTIQEAINYVRNGFTSRIAEDKTLMAEGLVCRTPCGLLKRNGTRIITKIKYADFVKYRNKYGTDGPVEQEANPNY